MTLGFAPLSACEGIALSIMDVSVIKGVDSGAFDPGVGSF